MFFCNRQLTENISQRSSLLIVCLPKATAVIYYSLQKYCNWAVIYWKLYLTWTKQTLQFQIKATSIRYEMHTERKKESKRRICIKKSNIKHALYFSSSSSYFFFPFYLCIIIKLLRFFKDRAWATSYERLSSHGW